MSDTMLEHARNFQKQYQALVGDSFEAIAGGPCPDAESPLQQRHGLQTPSRLGRAVAGKKRYVGVASRPPVCRCRQHRGLQMPSSRHTRQLRIRPHEGEVPGQPIRRHTGAAQQLPSRCRTGATQRSPSLGSRGY